MKKVIEKDLQESVANIVKAKKIILECVQLNDIQAIDAVSALMSLAIQMIAIAGVPREVVESSLKSSLEMFDAYTTSMKS